MINSLMNYSLFMGLIFLLSACGSTKGYLGSNDTGLDTAIVKAHGVTFHKVNGIDVGLGSSGLEVLAGKNEIELSVNVSNYNAREDEPKIYMMQINAEPGLKYAVTSKRGSGHVCAYELNKLGDPDFSASAGCIQR